MSGLYAGLQAFAPSPANSALDFDIFNQNLVDIDSYAAFTQESYAVTDRLTLTAGVRYTTETKTDDARSYRRVSQTYNFPPTKRSGAYYNLSPKFGADYQVTPDLLAYASIAEGFNSGGFIGHALSVDVFNGYGPEKV